MNEESSSSHLLIGPLDRHGLLTISSSFQLLIFSASLSFGMEASAFSRPSSNRFAAAFGGSIRSNQFTSSPTTRPYFSFGGFTPESIVFLNAFKYAGVSSSSSAS